jgi:23S rRNA (adenine2030-N6)-methyltransferase
LNYRHHFHAGNFADLVKHAALTAVLERMQADAQPLLVIDTHAGAGGYDLPPEAARAGEAAAAARLARSDAPAAFSALKQAIEPDAAGGLFYPGSPWITARTLRPGDRLLACELRADDYEALAQRLGGDDRVEVLQADGYEVATERVAGEPGRVLVLVDPPYERADDYQRVVDLLAAGLRARPDAVFLVWAPLKDMETLDRFVRQVEALRPPAGLLAETRLRRLTDPMRLNGCALLLINDPGVAQAVETACRWVAAELGDAGGEGRVWRLQT